MTKRSSEQVTKLQLLLTAEGLRFSLLSSKHLFSSRCLRHLLVVNLSRRLKTGIEIYTTKELKSKAIWILKTDTFWHSSAHILETRCCGCNTPNMFNMQLWKLLVMLQTIKRTYKYLGEIETWDKAESALAEALDEFGTPWKIEMLSESINETLDKDAAEEELKS
ncbi:hypothetical protein MKW98_018725 [Papaver atlanticum]|uniref:Uncharacterized protein n=1 Tax=Papaver atlanticum TaxID=357466 RepID=A0AAD4T6I0_9MAGN|nr:hypothetical protein MKW98_018725 [Papaver atlanticum]